MADSYVTSGATIKCSCGDKTAKLTVYPDRTVFLTEKPMANISDHVSMRNVFPFGKCHTTSYPPTGSATAANHGCLTPMPCVPGTISEWLQGKADYIIKGKPALLKSSYCKCQWGGIITITNDGQTDTGDADLNKVALQSEEEMLKKQEEEELAENAKLDVNAVLDGIQTALDLAGFAPGVGAVPDLLNAALSACRGNWAEAGLSVLAAVPGIGDAAAGVKLANRGVKMAKAAQKVEKTAEVGKNVKKATKAGDATKQASKVESNPTALSEYRKAEQDRLIDKSPNVKRFPEQRATTESTTASIGKGQSGEIIHIDHYEVKQVKVGNGKTEKVLEKKTDTTVASIEGGDKVNPPTNINSYMGHAGSNGYTSSGGSCVPKTEKHQSVFKKGTLGKEAIHPGENDNLFEINKELEEIKKTVQDLSQTGKVGKPKFGLQ